MNASDHSYDDAAYDDPRPSRALQRFTANRARPQGPARITLRSGRSDARPRSAQARANRRAVRAARAS